MMSDTADELPEALFLAQALGDLLLMNPCEVREIDIYSVGTIES